MAEEKFSDWQCPPAATAEYKRLGWLSESTEDGQNALKANRGYSSDYRKFMDVIAGKIDDDTLLDYRSAVNTNELKTNIRQVIGAMAKLRPIWGYSSGNKGFAKYAEMMNQVTRAVYLQSEASGPADRTIRDALQWAAATTKGYVIPSYQKDLATGRGGIYHEAYGNPSVLPVQMPANRNLQQAYTVHVMTEWPIFKAHALFPKFQDRLLPTTSKYWHDADIRKSAKVNTGWWNRMASSLRRGKEGTDRANLFVPIRKSYIIDLTLNETDAEIPMGEQGTSWFYKVPYMGQEIVRGGKTKKADESDCRLYPMRRLIISSQDCIMYDDTAFDWHGLVPVIPFSFDEWAWGDSFGLVHDGYELQKAMTAIERGSMDKVKARLDIPLAYDINQITKKEAEQFDPMQPRARAGFDGMAGDMPFKEVVPKEVYEVASQDLAMHKLLSDAQKRCFALNDLMQLAQARALGSGSDNIEQILGNVGPIIEDMSRGMEPSMSAWGNIEKYLVLQYFDTPRVMQYVGIDGVPEGSFDYHPNSLVPSHVAGEDPDKIAESSYSRIERAKMFADNLLFTVTPHSIHELTQMTQKLGLIQLKKAGVKISSETLAEAWNVPNYGHTEGSTEVEKFRAEQEDDLLFAARMKQVAEGIPGLLPPPGAAALGKNPEGRPSSNNKPPHLSQKDSGTRSTIATS